MALLLVFATPPLSTTNEARRRALASPGVYGASVAFDLPVLEAFVLLTLVASDCHRCKRRSRMVR